jgi:hypothetical protein
MADLPRRGKSGLFTAKGKLQSAAGDLGTFNADAPGLGGGVLWFPYS